MKSKKKRTNRIGRIALGIVRKFAPQVTGVTDADDDLLISVTPADEKASKKKDHNECALAVAVKRQEHAGSVIISSTTAYVIKGNHATRYKVPESASREVVSFDRGSEFCPGQYKLKAVSKSSRLGKDHSADTRNQNRPSTGALPKRFVHHTANIRTSLKAK